MNDFVVRPICNANFAECAALMREHEKTCVALVSQFVSNNSLSLCKKADSFYAVYKRDFDSQSLCALIMVDKKGIIFHCIDAHFFLHKVERTQFCRVVSSLFEKSAPYCLMGEPFGTELLLEACTKNSRVNLSYDFFEFSPYAKKNTESNVVLPAGFFLRQCTVCDAETLLPLQCAYEIEEVIPAGETHSKRICMIGLKKTLNTQHVFAIFNAQSGMPIAKAGTNAQGISWAQIGGVYTEPAWRSYGFARILVSFIAQKLTYDGKKIVLFVKSANIPAKRAYTKAGFVPSGAYQMVYF